MKYKYIVLTKHYQLLELLQEKLGPEYLVVALEDEKEDIKFIKIEVE